MANYLVVNGTGIPDWRAEQIIRVIGGRRGQRLDGRLVLEGKAKVSVELRKKGQNPGDAPLNHPLIIEIKESSGLQDVFIELPTPL